MNRKWFHMIFSLLAAALAVFIILTVTFRNTKQDLQDGAAIMEEFKGNRETAPVGTDIPYGSTLEEHQHAFEKWGDTDMDADSRADYPDG